MGNLNETEKWEENIYQLETSDPVLGGADGISNRAPRQLANRTKWLKKKTEEAAQSLAEHVRSRNHPDATLTKHALILHPPPCLEGTAYVFILSQQFI